VAQIRRLCSEGVRELGIPTVTDRLIQQALLQVLQPGIDPTFSDHSYGFRPGRRAHDAVLEAQRYVQEGYRVVVDVGLEKFFDRVNHDILMDRLSRRIDDKAVLRLIRRYLQATHPATHASLGWAQPARDLRTAAGLHAWLEGILPTCADTQGIR
jgi:retron-type reverse transcriptase